MSDAEGSAVLHAPNTSGLLKVVKRFKRKAIRHAGNMPEIWSVFDDQTVSNVREYPMSTGSRIVPREYQDRFADLAMKHYSVFGGVQNANRSMALLMMGNDVLGVLPCILITCGVDEAVRHCNYLREPQVRQDFMPNMVSAGAPPLPVYLRPRSLDYRGKTSAFEELHQSALTRRGHPRSSSLQNPEERLEEFIDKLYSYRQIWQERESRESDIHTGTSSTLDFGDRTNSSQRPQNADPQLNNVNNTTSETGRLSTMLSTDAIPSSISQSPAGNTSVIHCKMCKVIFNLWISLFPISLAIGIWRSIATSDEGKGFTVAAYLAAIGGLIILPMQNRHQPGCKARKSSS
jgi:hypothetical protein